jgi:hypothetical protein
MAKKEGERIGDKPRGDESPITIDGGFPIEDAAQHRDISSTSSLRVNLEPQASDPHQLISIRQSHKASSITFGEHTIKLTDNDWSICVFPHIALVFAESDLKTVRCVSRQGFEMLAASMSRDKDRSPFEKVEIRVKKSTTQILDPTFSIVINFK